MEGPAHIRRILVAVKDPAAPALPAVNKALQIARGLGAEVELFHAVDTPFYTDMLGINTPRGEALAGEELREYLQRLERVAARGRLHAPRVTAAVECDYPFHEAVVRRGHSVGAGLIVAECHAGRRFAPALLRLADRELLRSSTLPLLLVKGRRPYHHPTIVLADAQLAATAGRLGAALQGRVQAVPGAAPSAIAAAARRLKADLVIAGGKRAMRLLECVPCDLLIVKPGSGAVVSPTPRGPRVTTVEPLG